MSENPSFASKGLELTKFFNVTFATAATNSLEPCCPQELLEVRHAQGECESDLNSSALTVSCITGFIWRPFLIEKEASRHAVHRCAGVQ